MILRKTAEQDTEPDREQAGELSLSCQITCSGTIGHRYRVLQGVCVGALPILHGFNAAGVDDQLVQRPRSPPS